MTEEARHESEVVRRYEGEGIVVVWEPSLCIHTGNCLRGLPQVFDARARPWVQPKAASAEELVQTILSCPSGALSFQMADEARAPADNEPTTIEPTANGPLFLRGRLEVVDSRDNVLRRTDRLALCRCGHSQNKPYCDLSHLDVGFRA